MTMSSSALRGGLRAIAALAPLQRPILFSGPMVRAILEGRKTQTRRVMKPAPHLGRYGDTHPTNPNGLIADDYFVWEGIPVTPGCMYRLIPACPYGNAGDRLWVREAWNTTYTAFLAPGEVIGKSVDDCVRDNRGFMPPCSEGVVYSADGVQWHPHHGRARWKPSIHMPRWASRITLEITDVRIERVQDITNEDAIAEGRAGGPDVPGYSEANPADPYEHFAHTWDLLNEKRGYGWNANPWVWVIGFRTVLSERSPNEGPQ